ncbi:hypothetical protein FRC19_004761 [Serendipita sp. 401]|nr:hypothetical protein FRC19_004761 [Serendipita sp. 401]
MINDPYIQQWKRDVSRNTSTTSLPHPASSSKGQTSSTGTFILPTQPRDGLSKTNSIYPEATMASISSAGSSAWHSVNGGSSFVSIAPTSATSVTSTSDDPLSTPKFAQLPPPPALRRANPPKPLVPIGTNTKVQPPPPSFRRRTTGPPSATASELLDHPQIKAALQKHKELSWRSVQEQVGGSWEPRSELKVMFGEGAPGNLMKRYSASEILDPINWNRSQAQQTSLRGDEASTDPKRVWFQVRPEMKGATDAAGIKDEPNDAEEGRVHKLEIEGDTIMQDAEKAPKERLISASKELMINQLFPKYQPYIPGLPSGAIYLRHDHDRFEFRPYGWGHREDHDDGGAGGYDSRDPQSMALIRTPSGTPGGRFIAPENRRLLQWSLAQARWLFVLNELPTKERPRLPGGYPIPDRLDSFLQQGEVVRRLDFDPNHVRQQNGGGMMMMMMMETPGQWEWVLPIREKLWVSPMDEIVKKCGKIAAPVWDLGGRMLWDEVVGQWKFEISAPTREVRETLTDKDGVGREVMYDVCEGGRPRVSWNDFMGARDYLLILRRKITKLKAKARAQSAVRLPPSEALPPTSLELPKIKKEEDLDSNLSDSGMDQDSSIMSTSSVTGMSSIGEKERQPPVLTDHGQRCASLLINMMMSVGRSPLPPPASNATNKDNAISLDLGPAPAPASASAPLQPGDKLHLNVNLGRNNGFGEIGSASPSLSPTGSHVSAQRSVSVEDVDDDEEGSIAT